MQLCWAYFWWWPCSAFSSCFLYPLYVVKMSSVRLFSSYSTLHMVMDIQLSETITQNKTFQYFVSGRGILLRIKKSNLYIYCLNLHEFVPYRQTQILPKKAKKIKWLFFKACANNDLCSTLFEPLN